jgi:hypothetical protein
MRVQVSAQPPAKTTAGLIKNRNLKSEYRIMNVEYRRKVFWLFYKKTEHSETTLRNSAVRHSIFCGSLFRLGEVSYEVSEDGGQMTEDGRQKSDYRGQRTEDRKRNIFG